jgi:Predicted transcriptional regulators
MEAFENTLVLHKGRKIERVRKLRGLTQTDLAQRLGITKQAVSKLEQAEKIGDEKLKEIASALEVTFEGLRDFSEEKVLYNTNNFYENCGVITTNMAANIENINNPLKELIEVFEKQLSEVRRELVEVLKKK